MQYKHLKTHLHWHVGRHLSRRQKIRLAGASLGLFTVVAVSSIILNYQLGYLVSPQAKTLLSKSSVDLKKIKQTETGYVFNRQEAESKDPLKKLTVAGTTDATGKLPFQAELPKDAKDGISFKDQSGELAVKLIPRFDSSSGRLTDDGHVIYPAGQSEQHVYTFKRNGLKEDILLRESPGDSKTYAWQLETNGLEAKLMPSGAVGFYSSNPMLYGDITASSPADQALVDKARKNGKKDQLAFIIPTPYIKDSQGVKHYEDVKFSLKDNLLTLTATELDKQAYPISIDPSIAVTTTNGFQIGSDTGMIDYSDSDQITRSNISSGQLASGVNQSFMFNGMTNQTAVVNQGYLYIIGGFDGSGYSDEILACPINSDGSVGGCGTSINLTVGRSDHASVVYNNVIYVIGGYTGTQLLNDIEVCPIEGDGVIISCTQQTNAFSNARRGHGAAAYNGYLYITDGIDGSSNLLTDVVYCPIRGDGNVGSCTRQTGKGMGVEDHGTGIYNGRLYTVGGHQGSTFYSNSIQYCDLNSNGSVGTCGFQSNAFTNVRAGHGVTFANGYLYIVGGGEYGVGVYDDVQYCDITANGPIQGCTTQTTMVNAMENSVVAYNGFIYSIAGESSGYINSIDRFAIKFNGAPSGAAQEATTFTSARAGHGAVAYNGYLYIVGGTDATLMNDISRCPMYANGSVGTCIRQTSAFTSARTGHSSIVHNNYLYIIGGSAAASATGCDAAGRCNDIQRCPISSSDGSIGTCIQQTSAFTSPRTAHTVVVIGGTLYIIGGQAANNATGCDSSGRCQDVQYCTFAPNSSLNACTQQTAKLTNVRWGHATAYSNGYIYVIGGISAASATGCDAGGYCNDIIRCAASGGSVGTCTQQTSAFTSARQGHDAAITNNVLYISGGAASPGASGCDLEGYCSDVQYCPINTNRSVGSCTQFGSWSAGKDGIGLVVNNGFLYATGGYNDNSTYSNSIERMSVGINQASMGSVGTTAQQTSMYADARLSHTSVVNNGNLYIIGGVTTGGTSLNDIQYCPIGSDGSIGTCQSAGTFTTARSEHTSVVYNGNLYIIGGLAGSALDDIQYCPFNSNGTVGTCQSAGTFTTARYGHTSVAYKGYLYIIGGLAGSVQNDIQRCPFNSNGTLGTCLQQTNAFTTARHEHTSVVYNGYLFIVGGFATSNQNDIQHCLINDDGTVSTCVQQTSVFTTTRNGHTSVGYNGFLYIIGGTSGTNQNDIQRCPIEANGYVGTCVQQTSAFTSARNDHSSIVYNGYIYIIGGQAANSATGCDSAGRCNDIQRLWAKAPSYTAHYERTFNMVSDIYTLNSITVNGSTACGLTLSYATAGTDGIYGATTTVSQVSMGTAASIGDVTGKQYVRILLTANDDVCGSKTQINEINLNYTIPPPDAPVLLSPANVSYGNVYQPTFQMRSRAPMDSPLRYKIDVCTTSDCSSILRTIDQTSSQTGWTGQNEDSNTAYTGSSIDGDSSNASHTYQNPALSPGTQYWWRAYAIDYSNGSDWSSASAIQSFYTQKKPDAPVLTEPPNMSGGVSLVPMLRLRSADQDSDYLRYKIDVCTTSDCSSILRTIDQTSAQTGWSSQSQQSATAYASAQTAGASQTAVHTYQPTALTSNTQYWWRAYAIDPGGTNTWSDASSIGTFTTLNTATGQAKSITGGSVIRGGTAIGN